MQNASLIDYVHIETSISKGFPILKFDYRRIRFVDPDLYQPTHQSKRGHLWFQNVSNVCTSKRQKNGITQASRRFRYDSLFAGHFDVQWRWGSHQVLSHQVPEGHSSASSEVTMPPLSSILRKAPVASAFSHAGTTRSHGQHRICPEKNNISRESTL